MDCMYAGLFRQRGEAVGSYYFEYIPALGKGMWMTGLAIHAVHIMVFTYRNVLKERDIIPLCQAGL